MLRIALFLYRICFKIKHIEESLFKKKKKKGNQKREEMDDRLFVTYFLPQPCIFALKWLWIMYIWPVLSAELMPIKGMGSSICCA